MDLKSIKVFDADTGAELAVSDYSYVISDPEAVDNTVSCSADVITNEKGKFIANFIPSESIVGAKGTIDLTLPEGYENGNIKSYYVAYGYMDGNSFKEVKAFANKRSEWLDLAQAYPSLWKRFLLRRRAVFSESNMNTGMAAAFQTLKSAMKNAFGCKVFRTDSKDTRFCKET